MTSSKHLTFKTLRKYAAADDPTRLYDAALAKLADLPAPWGMRDRAGIALVERSGEVNLTVRYPQDGKTSPSRYYQFAYATRKRLGHPPDGRWNNDTLTVEFYPSKVEEDWKYLLDVVFTSYISATRPYRATLFDEAIDLDDSASFDEDSNEMRRHPDYIDWGAGVYRIWQANYWDRGLCTKGFGLAPEEIVQRLSGAVANCRLSQGELPGQTAGVRSDIRTRSLPYSSGCSLDRPKWLRLCPNARPDPSPWACF